MSRPGELAARVTVASDVVRTVRVLQCEGIFDVPPSTRAELVWEVRLPLHEWDWHIGLVVGPSGSGKSTIARALWPDELAQAYDWPRDESVLDGFPAGMGIKAIVELLCSVGFSSPPSWLRPFGVLSTGEQFRVMMARVLAEQPALAVVDEYSSVVDRTVAQIGSAALAKTIRKRGQRFVAVTCHEDVEAWLQPDWVYCPATNTFAWRCLRGRPAIQLDIGRVHHSAWTLFRRHHYLDTKLNTAAVCFCAWWQERPVAFSAWLHMPSGTIGNAKREHRTVCLPDYQGVGIGNALSEWCAGLWLGLGYRAISTTSHPGMTHKRAASSHWRLHRVPGTQLHAGGAGVLKPDLGGRAFRQMRMRRSVAATRITAGFEYIGPALPREQARRLLDESARG